MAGNECYKGKKSRIRRGEWEGRCQRVREASQKEREDRHQEAGVLTPALLSTCVCVGPGYIAGPSVHLRGTEQ